MLNALLIVALIGQVAAQNVRPQIGYVYPPGGRAGTTVDVQLGSYDWTPDMQVFVHDSRVKIELTGSASEFILTPPPYWFGAKAGIAQPPLAKEVPARITIPADIPPGPFRWQVANANGGSNVGTFMVGDLAEFIEPEKHAATLDVPNLPVVISGRISKITEIDNYRFQTTTSGLVTCRLDDRLGQPFSGMLSVRNANGTLLADAADTIGGGAVVMFAALADSTYTIQIRDIDFAGDRGYVYRLTIEQGPRVVATLPCVLARGKTTQVEIIGWGVATGSLHLESITQNVSVPANAPGEDYSFMFDTSASRARATILLGEESDSLEPVSNEPPQRLIAVPTALSGVLDRLDPDIQMPLDRYTVAAKKGESLRFKVEAARLNSPVDPSIVVRSAVGKELARNDDLPDTVDAAVAFEVPEDGVYEIQVSDYSGIGPSRASVYRLLIENLESIADFTLQAPDRLDVPIGGQAELVVKTARRGTWDERILLKIENLPTGATVLEIPSTPTPPLPTKGDKRPAKKPGAGDVKLTIAAAADASAGSQLATLVATTTVDDREIERRFGPILISTTLKTRCKVKSAVQDGGRIVNRGTTYPADVLVERLEGYDGTIQLQMASAQQRQRRGIRGSELIVPPGVDQVQYPVFMPEWLETNLTARINVIGVAQVADPKGNVRHVTGIMDGFIVMSLEGALLKLSHEPSERVVTLAETIEIPLKVSRSVKLHEAVRLELVPDDNNPHLAVAEPVNVPADEVSATMSLRIGTDPTLVGERSVTSRATAMQNGRWPTLSETVVPLVIQIPSAVAEKCPNTLGP